MRQQKRLDLLNRHSMSQRSDPKFKLIQEVPHTSLAQILQGASTNRVINARSNVNASSLPQLRSKSIPTTRSDFENTILGKVCHPALIPCPNNLSPITESGNSKSDRPELNGYTQNLSIKDIIQQCNEIFQSTYMCKSYYISSKNAIENVEKQIALFKTLHSIIQQPNGIQKIGVQNISSFIHMIQNHLVHPLSELPKRFLYCDVVPTINSIDWPVVDICYSIFIILIRSFDNKMLTNILNAKFVHGLLSMLKSPDKREQNAVANLTYSIVDFNQQMLPVAFKCLNNFLNDYVTGEVSFVGIETALKMLRQLFRSHKTLAYSINLQKFMFQTVLLLFNSPFAQEIFQPLTGICSFVYEVDEKMPSITLNYLFKHWPLSNSVKTTLFLEHIVLISTKLKKIDQITAEKVFRYIILSLRSSNFQIILKALQICNDLHFYSYYLSYLKLLIPKLQESLKNIENHWNEEIKKKTKEVMKKVDELIASSDRMEDCKPILGIERSNRDEIWSNIRKMTEQ
ncbi:hypothetical protein TRFO_22041 [Tritrichomonas foetus]|uniref:Phosphoprotein phosphatase n=1 Tax=Tritrichomonas foetus TaxID=1144522 RepID=A0A1J4KCQ8_9EUKA|nr:hypothetical protein TRFO_22041 [Tritrichomonas foetus]|eukprot:OHT09201.1 hypothetical protein TRFO_22041 [Tritrichomonas foetus]